MSFPVDNDLQRGANSGNVIKYHQIRFLTTVFL